MNLGFLLVRIRSTCSLFVSIIPATLSRGVVESMFSGDVGAKSVMGGFLQLGLEFGVVVR